MLGDVFAVQLSTVGTWEPKKLFLEVEIATNTKVSSKLTTVLYK
jgi:hypothetical protein